MESLIRLEFEPLPEGGYVATSPDVPGLVAQGRTLEETMEIARDVARKIAESCLENGDPLPSVFEHLASPTPFEAAIPVSVP
jgi:predicted RNase H-like HicB family nuclease